MSFEEYAAKTFNECQKKAINSGVSSEAVEVLQLIAQQNVLLIKSYHENVVLPLLTRTDDTMPLASGT